MRIEPRYKVERNALKVNKYQREYHIEQSKNMVGLLFTISIGILFVAGYILVKSLGSF